MVTSGAAPIVDDKYRQIARELGEFGWSAYADFVDAAKVQALAAELRAGWKEGEFRRAMIGTGKNKILRTDIRSDYVHWLDPARARAGGTSLAVPAPGPGKAPAGRQRQSRRPSPRSPWPSG